jgi:biopolymer transport protein ExbB
MNFDNIYYTIEAGGFVMLPLFFCGAIGFYFVLSCMSKLGRDVFNSDLRIVVERFGVLLVANDIEGARKFLQQNRGLVSQQLQNAIANPDWTEHRIRTTMSEKISALMVELDKGMHLAGVMATTAPLLGLLGTVAGMISTFQVLTTFGNSNPLLLADGISEALIATQSGLLIAIPLMLLQHRIEDRNHWIRKQLEHGMTIVLNWASTRNPSSPGNLT